MAKAAGLRGGGKKALRAVLMASLHDFNAIEVTPLIERADYPTLDEWHAAWSADFAKSDGDMAAVLDKYEPILNGCNSNKSALSPEAHRVIHGPWSKGDEGG